MKPGGKAAKDAVQQAQDQIPDSETSKKVATDNVGPAASQAADAVKKNADPLADKARLDILYLMNFTKVSYGCLSFHHLVSRVSLSYLLEHWTLLRHCYFDDDWPKWHHDNVLVEHEICCRGSSCCRQ